RHTRFSRDWSSDVCSSDLRIDHVATGFAELVVLEHLAVVEHIEHVQLELQLATGPVRDIGAGDVHDPGGRRTALVATIAEAADRSEERRVGKGCRGRWSGD